MAGYGWDEYDTRSGGRQTIHDTENMIDITTEFVKVPGGEHGGHWGARISGKPREDAPADTKTTVVFAANMEGLGGLELGNDEEALGYEGTVSLYGQSPELGSFKLDITEGPKSNVHPFIEHPSAAGKPLDRSIVNSLAVTPEAIWQTKREFFRDTPFYDPMLTSLPDRSCPVPSYARLSECRCGEVWTGKSSATSPIVHSSQCSDARSECSSRAEGLRRSFRGRRPVHHTYQYLYESLTKAHSLMCYSRLLRR